MIVPGNRWDSFPELRPKEPEDPSRVVVTIRSTTLAMVDDYSDTVDGAGVIPAVNGFIDGYDEWQKEVLKAGERTVFIRLHRRWQ